MMFWYKLSIFFQMMAFGFSSFLPLYWRDVAGLSESSIATLTAIGVALAIAAPGFFGKLGNRFPPHIPIWISFFVCAIAAPSFLISPDETSQGVCYVIFRFAIWGFFTLVPVGVLHLVGENVGRDYGDYRKLGSLGFLIGVVSGGWAGDSLGLPVVFILCGFTFLLAGIPFLRSIKISRPKKITTSYGKLYRNRFLCLFYLGITFTSTGFPFYFMFLPLRMAELNSSNMVISIALAMCGLTALVSLPAIGRYADRSNPFQLLLVLAVSCCVRIAIMYCPDTHAEWFIPIQLLHIPSWVLFDVLVIKLLKQFCLPEEFSPAQALVHIHSSIGMAMGSAIAAAVVESYSLRETFLICSAMPLLALIPFLLILQSPPEKVATT